LVETAVAAQWLGTPAAGDLAYAGWRGGSVDLVARDPRNGKPDIVMEFDWADHYGRPGKGPETLAQFAEANNRDAKVLILTRNLARPGVIRGIDVQLLPASLYAFLLVRDRLERREADFGPKVRAGA
ncbi:MAG: hypothetical protein ACPGNT_09820, partial [Rhodospirillales bacterium]